VMAYSGSMSDQEPNPAATLREFITKAFSTMTSEECITAIKALDQLVQYAEATEDYEEQLQQLEQERDRLRFCLELIASGEYDGTTAERLAAGYLNELPQGTKGRDLRRDTRRLRDRVDR
jgi:serine protease inhibitor ecotin